MQIGHRIDAFDAFAHFEMHEGGVACAHGGDGLAAFHLVAIGDVANHALARALGERRLVLHEHDDLRAIPPERMLAWNRHARFTVHSGRTAWTTLLNGYTLVRSPATDGPPGRILVSSAEVGSLLGSLRFIRRIVRAIF